MKFSGKVTLILLGFLLFLLPSLINAKKFVLNEKKPTTPEIGFIKKELNTFLSVPGQIVLTFRNKEWQYYKLERSGKIVSGGKLSSGLNFLFLNASDILSNNTEKQYWLFLKKGKLVQRSLIEIHIQKNKPDKKTETEKSRNEHKGGLSPDTENQLVFTNKYYLNPIRKLLSKRKHNSELAEKTVYSPFSLNTVNSVTGSSKPQQPTSIGFMGYIYLMVSEVIFI